MTPFKLSFKVDKCDYNSSKALTLYCIVENFLMRKPIIILDARTGYENKSYEREIAEYQLTKWIYIHLFYFSEANRLERFLLLFKKKQNVQGAIIKRLLNKTFIMELL